MPGCPGRGPIDLAQRRSEIQPGPCTARCRLYRVPTAAEGGAAIGDVPFDDPRWRDWAGAGDGAGQAAAPGDDALWEEEARLGRLARTCYVSSGGFGLLDQTRTACFREMRGGDVLFANMGIHYNEPNELREQASEPPARSPGATPCARADERAVARRRCRDALSSPAPCAPFPPQLAGFLGFWARSVEEEGAGALPTLLWREATAQHFEGGAGGNYYRGNSGKCAQIDFGCAAPPTHTRLSFPPS